MFVQNHSAVCEVSDVKLERTVTPTLRAEWQSRLLANEEMCR